MGIDIIQTLSLIIDNDLLIILIPLIILIFVTVFINPEGDEAGVLKMGIPSCILCGAIKN
jgi:hypothetical protein